MKLLIIGKTGQLGSALIDHAKSICDGYEIIAPSRDEFDISDHIRFEKLLLKHDPDFVINCAAFHNVPLCEKEPANAYLYNAVFLSNLARISQGFGSVFITFSTDYVFDGKKGSPYIETDIPKPLQVYGSSKYTGESMVLNSNGIVIRTCGLYGLTGARSKGGNFIDNRIEDARRIGNTGSIEIGSDEIVSPTFTGHLSLAILGLISGGDYDRGSVYHLVNEGYCSWYELTVETFRLMDIGVRVVPVKRGGVYAGTRRPLFSALLNTKAKNENGIELPHWKDALKDYIEIKYKSKIQKE